MPRRESLQFHYVAIAVYIPSMIWCAAKRHPNSRPHHSSVDVPHRETCSWWIRFGKIFGG
jgi:hypothetical protein